MGFTIVEKVEYICNGTICCKCTCVHL